MRREAADALSFALAAEFEPDRLGPAALAVYEASIRPSEADRAWVAETFGMARVYAWERRRSGWPDEAIRSEVLGHAHDHADVSCLPANRARALPREEFLALARAVIDQALGFTADDFSDWDGDRAGPGWPESDLEESDPG